MFSTILNTNIEDINYNEAYMILDDIETFRKVVCEFYSEVSKNRNSLENLVKEIDISRFVHSMTKNVEIGQIPVLRLILANPSSVGIKEDSSYIYPSNAGELSSLEFFENDFVYIDLYVGDKSIYEYSEEERPKLYRPYFRGFVTSINRNMTTGEVETIELVCHGIMKLLSMNALITGSAIYENFINLLEGFDVWRPEYFTVWQSRFSDKSVKDIVISLFEEVLHCKLTDDESSMYISLEKIFSEYISKTLSGQKFMFRPMLHLIILVLIVKSKSQLFENNLDPILVFDDHLFPVIESKYVQSLAEELRPYLIMTRNSYSLYESVYETPLQIMTRILEQTFFEFFEDSSGIIHFRAPRYNNMVDVYDIEKDFGYEFIHSFSYSKEDSGVYSAIGVHNVMHLVGTLELPKRVYLNRLLVSKFGLRVPRLIENPNVLTPHLGDLFARFYSDYLASESRTAEVVLAGIPNLELGKMMFISFDYSNFGYIGYIRSISDRLTVGGQYMQTVSLTKVRECSREDYSVSSKVKIIPSLVDYLAMTINLEDKLALLADMIDKYDPKYAEIIKKRNMLSSEPKNYYYESSIRFPRFYKFRPVMSLFTLSKEILPSDFHESMKYIQKINPKATDVQPITLDQIKTYI
ncbi:MAG: hypothetical protein QXS37_05970, partial [Candidatus Aenigmatarchaeota archaeon]